ncbi:MAG: anti-sigma factor family protein [Actinomycetota bacterium]
MSHNPEKQAAAYLGGAMSARAAGRFEAHLLACEQCWEEVAQARRGREEAESARELAPQALRESIRVGVLGSPRSRVTRRIWRPATAALAVAVLAAGAMLFVRKDDPAGPTPQPAPVARALADFTEARVPAERPASRPAPDLSEIGFSVAGAGGGRVGSIVVDGFTYRDSAGHRIQLYLSDSPFPEATGARRLSREKGPWIASSEGIRMLCAERPWPLLAISESPRALSELASLLKIG